MFKKFLQKSLIIGGIVSFTQLVYGGPLVDRVFETHEDQIPRAQAVVHALLDKDRAKGAEDMYGDEFQRFAAVCMHHLPAMGETLVAQSFKRLGLPEDRKAEMVSRLNLNALQLVIAEVFRDLAGKDPGSDEDYAGFRAILPTPMSTFVLELNEGQAAVLRQTVMHPVQIYEKGMWDRLGQGGFTLTGGRGSCCLLL